MGRSNRHFYCFLNFRLSETDGILRRGFEPVTLGPKAIDTLLVLLRNRDRVLSRGELMKAVWPDSVVEENNLDQQITALRRVLSRDQIETIARRGYRFLPPRYRRVGKIGLEHAADQSLDLCRGCCCNSGRRRLADLEPDADRTPHFHRGATVRLWRSSGLKICPELRSQDGYPPVSLRC